MGVQAGHTGNAGRAPLRRRLLAALLRRWVWVLVALCALVVLPFVPLPHWADEKDGPTPAQPALSPDRADLERLSQALASRDNPTILALIRRRIPSPAERVKIASLIEQLGSPDFAARQRASRELKQLGLRAAGLLRRALNSADPETVSRARECLALCQTRIDIGRLRTGVRRLADGKLPRTVAVLLDYLPYAEDELIVEEIHIALAALTFEDGKPREVVLQALTDPEPERQAAAGVVLSRPGAEQYRPAVHRLLRDPDRAVRLRVALALLRLKDKAALPALVESLGWLPPEDAWPVVDLLSHIGGTDAPAVAPDRTPEQRGRCRAAWAEWWDAHGERLDLARRELPPRRPGPLGPPLFVAVMDVPYHRGVVSALTPLRTLDWKWGSGFAIDYPLSIQPLPGGRVLVAEYRAGRVTERNPEGRALWSKEVRRPVFAQRLPGGHTFIACRDRLLEVDAAGNEVLALPRRTRDVATARKLPDGAIGVVTQGGACQVHNERGEELSRFEAGFPLVLGGADVLPNRRFVLPDHLGNRVVEFGPGGEVLWQVKATAPTAACRLPDGHTLISSMTTGEIIEVDRGGEVLWKHETGTDFGPVAVAPR